MTISDSHRNLLVEALPWPEELIETAFTKVWLSRYISPFAELFVEAYNAYLGGCPRASIIVAGESLLRAVFVRIESEIVQRKTALTVQNRRGKTKTVGTDFELAELPDNLSFCEALDLLKQNRIIPEMVLDVAYTVKDLRNHAAHGQFPLLDQWDPDDPRPASVLKELIKSADNNKDIVFPEGYRFIPSKQRGTWFTFDCRKYHCGSLKELGTEEQYAAIQFCLVVDALHGMFQEIIRAGDRVEQK